MSEYQVPVELVAIFLEDARAHLEALDHCLLSLERDGAEPEVAASVLGPLHTLKGNSGMIGFGAVKDYVHRLEDVLGRVADGSLVLDAAGFDRLFAGASALRDAIERACAAQAEVSDLAAERAALDELLATAASAKPASPGAAAAPLVSDPAREARATGVVPYVTARSSVVRVEFAQLDHLLNLVGELIIYRTKLQELTRQISDVFGKGGGISRELDEAAQRVTGLSARLQETVMDIRMLPIRQVFERFPRLVRDLARQQGKQVELILEGETTRVDKAIIDELGEPLVHLIRNSLDHGIEPPAARVARGKTPTGTILLSASQESNQVVVTIMDDGAGIDPERVRRRARERGLLRGEALADRDALQLIFAPGFSTAQAVTELSGRGVGLDVVLKSIERLNGLVEVESVPGVGTKFTIQLPLTLAIISALLVETAGRTFAVPLAAVVESLRLREAAVQRVGGHDTLRLRDRVVPLARLSRLLGLGAAGAAPTREYVVVLGRGDKRLGVVVDRLVGQQEVVIKALDPAVSGAGLGVAGATVMGDGRVVLILDIAVLFEGRRHAGDETSPPGGRELGPAEVDR